MSDEPSFCFTLKSSNSEVFYVLTKLSTQVKVHVMNMSAIQVTTKNSLSLIELVPQFN